MTLTWAARGVLLFSVSMVGAQAGNIPRPTVAALEALVRECAPLPGTTRFAKDAGAAATVSICALDGAVFWTADLDVDCDGGRSALCRRDPTYLRETSATDSRGRPLDAAKLPYVVIPLPSRRFDFRAAGLQLGSVVAVLYRGRMVFGVFGDEGPKGIIGEASFALAFELGIDPHPVSGGADDGVTYIAFTGPAGVVSANEDHAEAERIGLERAARLIAVQ
jgi:Fungal chitosanase of glycosyl hydrolase group 75